MTEGSEIFDVRKDSAVAGFENRTSEPLMKDCRKPLEIGRRKETNSLLEPLKRNAVLLTL